MKIHHWKKIVIVCGLIFFFSFWSVKKFNLNPHHQIGEKLDSIDGVYVYFNGGVNHVSERNTAADGYNIGLKYQCVEFVKRYYYQHFHHKMPDSYGHAKDFFDKNLSDNQLNKKRDLLQFQNPSLLPPQKGDILVYSGTIWNRFGHVAIITRVENNQVEIIQQNPGPFSPSREHHEMKKMNGKWKISSPRILGWLRMKRDSL